MFFLGLAVALLFLLLLGLTVLRSLDDRPAPNAALLSKLIAATLVGDAASPRNTGRT